MKPDARHVSYEHVCCNAGPSRPGVKTTEAVVSYRPCCSDCGIVCDHCFGPWGGAHAPRGNPQSPLSVVWDCKCGCQEAPTIYHIKQNSDYAIEPKAIVN